VLEADACNGPEKLQIELAQTRSPRVLIVGAGATGVEAAAEIATRIDAKIILADNGIFGGFTISPVARRLRMHLACIGVDLRENCAIQSVAANQAETSKGPIDFDICINTTGFTGTPLATGTGLETTPGGRILTDPFLRALGDSRIYAVGDAGQPRYRCGAPPRMSVFFALATGAHAADAIADELAGRRKRPFGFWTYGQAFGLGRAALGFGNLPHDRAFPPYYTGRTGYYLRHFFVWLLLVILKIERRWPGLPFYLGRPWRRRPDNCVPAE
jgi:NADH dehydrogenase FAD-containing subunit